MNKIIKDFKFFKQKKSDDCWIACCKMTIDFLNRKNISYPDLVKQASKLSNPGSGEAISKLLSLYGIEYSYSIPFDTILSLEDKIKKNIEKNIPVIIGIPGHAVVIIGYNDEIIKKPFSIADPWTGNQGTIFYDDERIISDYCEKKFK